MIDQLFFVVLLLLMGLASVVQALMGSPVWWLGALAFFGVGIYAKRQLVREVAEAEEAGEAEEGASMGFVLKAIAVMLVAMAGMAWFFTG